MRVRKGVLRLTLRERLMLAWEGFTMDDKAWRYESREKGHYIFTRGVEAGISSIKVPGTYKVTVHFYDEEFTKDYAFDEYDNACAFIKIMNNETLKEGGHCELFQVHLDREIDYVEPIG